ncbi:unnamed protein product [Aspergillus oryzae]|nr:unnamed protein product [Aspergillus oryzae]
MVGRLDYFGEDTLYMVSCDTPHGNSHPYAQRTSQGPVAKAFPAVALAVRCAIASICGVLVKAGVDEAPQCSACCREHGNDTPVRAEVLNTPDNGDDDGAEGERAPVTEADKACGYMGQFRVLDRKGRCEEKIAK